MRVTMSLACALAPTVLPPLAAHAQFVNFETPHVHPIDLTPDGALLLAVNTADNRLEVFTVNGDALAPAGSIPVGLEPVSVRARTASEAWVVNHVSDSISVVDLEAGTVVATLFTGDEPTDVVFAGAPQRAFVAVSQLNQVKVFDPAAPASAPIVIPIAGEDPRALATDGAAVYAAIFESGNRTTILGEDTVSTAVNPYPGRPNPPPNAGAGFSPPMAAGLPGPPPASHIVRRDAAGVWRDVNGADWSAAVTWDLHDHDVAIIDADTLEVAYATGTMNLNMAIAPRPGGGVTVVGTEAINEVRFEPNINGVFVRVMGATVAGPGAPALLADLNPHLDYTTSTVSQALRDQSLGDPRGIAWVPGGARALVTGMGSNNVIAVDGALGRVDRVDVGQGPTGVVVSAAGSRAYVLNRFEATVSVLDANALGELSRVAFHDPTPEVVSRGRPFLYDTHATSGLGQASCASCHIDGRMDQLAWDLGDPTGEMKDFNQVCNFGIGGCEDWHPMKGPMSTQTLVGITGTEPLHWRGDREDLPAFNGAFESLLGDDTQLTAGEVDDFLAFVSTLAAPPNPFREIDGSLPTVHPHGGFPEHGEFLFEDVPLDLFVLACNDCHAGSSGTNGMLTSGDLLGEAQSIKVPQLRNLYEKTGFDAGSSSNNRGFGFIHDGSVDTLVSFLEFDGFQFLPGDLGDIQRQDLAAFLMCFDQETHAAVGLQAALPSGAMPGQRATAQQLIQLAASGDVDLVAKATVNGEARGWYLVLQGMFQSDRALEQISAQALINLASPAQPITFTAVPFGSGPRIGVDRDLDGYLDRDELDAGSNPADPDSVPGDTIPGDLDGDGVVGPTDLVILLAAWGPCAGECPADLDGNGAVGTGDLLILLMGWS